MMPLSPALFAGRPAGRRARLESHRPRPGLLDRAGAGELSAPDAARPFGQLTGGGPRPQEATLIRAETDAHVLKARMHALDGTLISEHVIARRRT